MEVRTAAVGSQELEEALTQRVGGAVVDEVVGRGAPPSFPVEAPPCWEVAKNVLSQSQHHPTLAGVRCGHAEDHNRLLLEAEVRPCWATLLGGGGVGGVHGAHFPLGFHPLPDPCCPYPPVPAGSS